ncbi:MAG TPA: hypothetical protein VFD92_07250 [Candidatus Binatia bacterium]|nr:hypothetical protein [Candidatus Binatia bacterium]
MALILGIGLVAAAIGIADREANAEPIAISGRVALSRATGVATCDTLDVVAILRKRSGSSVTGERRFVARAAALRSDGRRWSYSVDVDPFTGGAAQDVELSARCNSGVDPLLRHRVRVGAAAGWTNPFAVTANGGSLQRNFRVRVVHTTTPPAEVAMGPIATTAYGGTATSGAASCDAPTPDFSQLDPNGSFAGFSNDPGTSCQAQTTIDGHAEFDLSRLQEWSGAIESVELRYSEDEMAWRGPTGSSTSPSTCIAMAMPENEPGEPWSIGQSNGDHRTSWDVTDVVQWWLDSEDPAPSFDLLSVDPDDGARSACLSRVSSVELVVHFAF